MKNSFHASKYLLPVLFLMACACSNGSGNQIIAHKGYWNNPESGYGRNTVAALVAAEKAGFYGSEFDVQLSRDSVVVVCESAYVNGRKISEVPFSDIRFSGPIENGENPTSMERLLEQGAKGGKCRLFVHLQSQESPERDNLLREKADEVVEKLGLKGRVTYITDEEEIRMTDDPMAELLGGIEKRWMRDICSPIFNGRKAGTPGLDGVRKFIERELVAMDLNPEEQNWRFKDSLDFTNIVVTIPGETDSIVVCGAHYDGAVTSLYHQGADDNGSGIVALLSIARKLSGKQPHNTVVLGFWVAEESTGGSVFNGSTHFVETFPSLGKVALYINHDCFARKGQGVVCYHSPDRSDLASGVSGATVTGNCKFNSDYVPFHEAGIPFVSWNDENTSGYVHSVDDSMNWVDFGKLEFVVENTLKFL